MALRTTCPGCQTVCSLPDELRGKRIRCKKCQAIMLAGEAAPPTLKADDDVPVARLHRASTRPKQQSTQQANVEELEEARRRPRTDDEDRPRPVRRRRQKGNRGLWIGLTVGMFVLVLAGSGLAAYLLWDRLFDGPWPQPPEFPPGPQRLFKPDQTVTLHIAGVGDEYTAEKVSFKLLDLADKHVDAAAVRSQVGDRMTVKIVPAADPQAVAQKINFGTVRRVSGRTITVDAHKAEGPAADADAVAKALFDLKSIDSQRRLKAFQVLKDQKPDGRREEVLKAIDPLLHDPHPPYHDGAMDVVVAWAPDQAATILLPLLTDIHLFPHTHLIQVLGRLKDERTIEPLARCLGDPIEANDAAGALKPFGPAAEKAVAKRLTERNRRAREAACDLLKDIGTKDSLAELEKLAQDKKDRALASRANEAIKAIRARP
jgi:HEAT repeat protein